MTDVPVPGSVNVGDQLSQSSVTFEVPKEHANRNVLVTGNNKQVTVTKYEVKEATAELAMNVAREIFSGLTNNPFLDQKKSFLRTQGTDVASEDDANQEIQEIKNSVLKDNGDLFDADKIKVQVRLNGASGGKTILVLNGREVSISHLADNSNSYLTKDCVNKIKQMSLAYFCQIRGEKGAHQRVCRTLGNNVETPACNLQDNTAKTDRKFKSFCYSNSPFYNSPYNNLKIAAEGRGLNDSTSFQYTHKVYQELRHLEEKAKANVGTKEEALGKKKVALVRLLGEKGNENLKNQINGNPILTKELLDQVEDFNASLESDKRFDQLLNEIADARMQYNHAASVYNRITNINKTHLYYAVTVKEMAKEKYAEQENNMDEVQSNRGEFIKAVLSKAVNRDKDREAIIAMLDEKCTEPLVTAFVQHNIDHSLYKKLEGVDVLPSKLNIFGIDSGNEQHEYSVGNVNEFPNNIEAFRTVLIQNGWERRLNPSEENDDDEPLINNRRVRNATQNDDEAPHEGIGSCRRNEDDSENGAQEI